MSDIKGFLVWIIAIILKMVLFVPMLISGIIGSIKRKSLGNWWLKLGEILDKYGNVLGGDLLTLTLLKNKDIRDFGRDETISLTMAFNDRENNLSKFGRLVKKILNFVDNNHLEKTLNNYERRN